MTSKLLLMELILLVSLPDRKGHFGKFGGCFVPETLMSALIDLDKAYQQVKQDDGFIREYQYYLNEYVGRPNSLYFAKRLSEQLTGAKIYLKREDLNHTGSHKINNTIGQALLAKKMGKKKIVAETGAGQHGVATATIAANMGLECKIFMGAKDVARQKLNVFKMKLLGAEVISVNSGAQTLKDATNEAFRYWMASVEDTYYLIGSVVGPHPYPEIVRDFQSVIGKETAQQVYAKEHRLPDFVIACVGGGSNAMGIFYPFLNKPEVELIGVEAAGEGLDSGKTSATLNLGKPGVFQGAYSYVLQDENGQINEAHSVAPGLDYPGVGPEHSFLKDADRVKYTFATNEEAWNAYKTLSQTEGIIPALESSHAIAEAIRLAPKLTKNKIIVVCLSGRGDKDSLTAMDYFKDLR